MVVARADVQQVAAAAQVVRRRDGIRDARAVDVLDGAGQHFFLAVAGQHLQRVSAHVERVLPRELVLARVQLRDAGSRRAREAAKLVFRTRHLDAAAPVGQEAVVQEDGIAVDFLEIVRVEGRLAAVVLRVHAALQELRADLVALGQAQGDAGVDAVARIAVVIRVVARRAGTRGREAVRLFARAGQRVRHAVLAARRTVHAGVVLVRAVRAAARAGAERRRARALLREDLHDTADGIRAVQGAQGAVDDLDMVDGRQRDGVPRGRARRCGADAHA
ncbi:conserved hypothetical protein, partial [Ricinus communis]